MISCRQSSEATHSVGWVQKGPLFPSTLSLQQFHVLSRIIQSDNRDTQPARWWNDKLAGIRKERWVECPPLMYNPGPEVSVDEHLAPSDVAVPSSSTCQANQASVESRSRQHVMLGASYAWNMQVYTGNPIDGRPEKKAWHACYAGHDRWSQGPQYYMW